MPKIRDENSGREYDVPERPGDEALAAMEQALGHVFADKTLLATALTHPSMSDLSKTSYERLEFLGDAVLGLVVAEHLYHRFPDADEGELTRIKSTVVSRAALAHLGKRLKVIDRLRMAKGMVQQGPISRAVIANATEALIGALYADAGYGAARDFVLAQLGALIRRSSAKRPASNHKSLLQLYTQRLGLGTPSYEVVGTQGPDHERLFEVRTVLQGRVFATAMGATKKKAEQRAARHALRALEAEAPGVVTPPAAPDAPEGDDGPDDDGR